MCNRYIFISNADAIKQIFRTTGPQPNLRQDYNIAPTDDIPVIRMLEESRETVSTRWGLLPRWLKEYPKNDPVTNARAEGIEEKPMFRDAIRQRRCLIPADGYYEWHGKPGSKQPWFIRLKTRDTFAFAGIWERWKPPAENEIYSSAIVTTEPNGVTEVIHDRMPVILSSDHYDRWLDAATPLQEALSMLRPFPEDLMEAYKVGKEVGDVKADGPGLIEPGETLLL